MIIMIINMIIIMMMIIIIIIIISVLLLLYGTLHLSIYLIFCICIFIKMSNKFFQITLTGN